jgi:hypothetical protein
MTALSLSDRDWSYRDAVRRLAIVGGAELPRHTATARLDQRGNRIVGCGCGWGGNALGWANHIDAVVHSALDG